MINTNKMYFDKLVNTLKANNELSYSERYELAEEIKKMYSELLHEHQILSLNDIDSIIDRSEPVIPEPVKYETKIDWFFCENPSDIRGIAFKETYEDKHAISYEENFNYSDILSITYDSTHRLYVVFYLVRKEVQHV